MTVLHTVAPDYVTLDPREVAALTAVAIGLTEQAAGHAYDISPRTLRRAKETAVRKLGAYNITHAVALATARGHIDPVHLLNRTLPPCDFVAGRWWLRP
ncbi:MAG TPA: LuxR C-terminal-related transcriptional regulator [Streptosporangiaceae bacterium]|nr:LuxR C-terminal-related transcriptional regulator [Streptosporangiaceae bacterium]